MPSFALFKRAKAGRAEDASPHDDETASSHDHGSGSSSSSSSKKDKTRGNRGGGGNMHEKPTDDADEGTPMTSTPTQANGTAGPARKSLRELFRRATVKRPKRSGRGAAVKNGSTTTSPSTRSSVPASQASHSQSVSQAPPASPLRSLADSNKPLPSPPSPGPRDEAGGEPKRPVLKLERIMATLNDAEIEKLFSGAPQYFARSQGLGTGAPHPSVAFPWDEELTIRDLTDHTQIEHDAWGCITSSPRIIQRDPLSAASVSGRRRAHFKPKCCERPNTLSMQGLEKGTVGYQAALEMAVADALQEEQYGFDSLGAKSPVVMERRQQLITSKDGLRHLDDAAIMEQLMRCEERYHSPRKDHYLRPFDLYNELFLKLLHPPTRSVDPKNPYSLAAQIYSLVKVLATPNAWIDFSHVEWRIRLGQILWGFPLDDEVEDGSSINEGVDARDRGEERYWLLLQLLLACELLMRLDAITDGDEFGMGDVKQSEIHKFEKEANSCVRWSLVLARSWLENITISKNEAPQSGASTPKGWLTTLTNKMSLKHEHIHSSLLADHSHHHRQTNHGEQLYTIKGRYTERQVEGLTLFARKLRWPDIESYITRVSINAPAMARATPINTPLPTSDTNRSSYFGGDKRPGTQRQPSRRRKVEAALHSSGWLSKSFCSGLVLPGEALSHFLMSTLLENDKDAMAKLGPMANLCGGFVYNGKSFWSTACIVGRVLAAGQGSAECMGWISSDIIPRNTGDGWVDIDVVDIPDDMARTGKKARLWGKNAVERESDVLGDADQANVLPADFIIPHENHYDQPPPSNIRIQLKGLDLLSPANEGYMTPPSEIEATPFSDSNGSIPEIQTRPASLTFSMTHDNEEQEEEFSLSLSKDIHFVTAHPCVPSSRVKLFRSATSPTIQQIDVAGHDWSGKSSNTHAHIIGHPLHKFYTYTAIHITDLLKKRGLSLEELVGPASQTPVARSRSSSATRPGRVLVIDCITGMAPPSSPQMASLSRMSSISSEFGLEPLPTPQLQLPTPPRGVDRRASTDTSGSSHASRIDPPNAESKMRIPSRRRQFGSDLEIMVRAICADKGWNAIISRRRRGCLACAIREAGALGWRVVIRVE